MLDSWAAAGAPVLMGLAARVRLPSNSTTRRGDVRQNRSGALSNLQMEFTRDKR